MSSSATPFDLNSVISSSLVRPGSRPATMRQSSVTDSQLITPRSIAGIKSPASMRDCSIESTAIIEARLIVSTSTSDLDRKFEPTTFRCVPGSIHSPFNTGSRALVAVITIDWPRAASSGELAPVTSTRSSEVILRTNASRRSALRPYAAIDLICLTAHTAISWLSACHPVP